METANKEKKKVSRRDMLKYTVAAGAGVAIGASGFGSIAALSEGFNTGHRDNQNGTDTDQTISLYGKNQAGITTVQQKHAYLATMNLLTSDKQDIIRLFKDWTAVAAALTEGSVIQNDGRNDFLPPMDTGESEGLPASRLTITFGLGPTFFQKDGVDRYDIAAKMPALLKDIPSIPGDSLQDEFTGGDLCIQACADHQQVAFHAIRNLIKAASGIADIHYLQSGFIEGPEGETPRNLFGFKDGTANPSAEDKNSLNEIVWAEKGEPDWMKGGTYMAVRKIQMMIEMWDRLSLKDQEDTFGRKKMSGAAYGSINEHDDADLNQMPVFSHTRMARETKQQILRRAYSYTDGIDKVTGNMNAGLLFICFQKNPDIQFVPMLKMLAKSDMLNAYIRHIGSGMFAIPGGIKKGGFLAQQLFE